ncbi:unnamed protein product [Phytophthora lilii]|uniref:Unnamed protein product n=1 Tax=Phytophthora lilii TaxID=2077276 RepID=A0A9W6TW78_9STRA|nr:unnamed protein product [Phytophthora lilii]
MNEDSTLKSVQLQTAFHAESASPDTQQKLMIPKQSFALVAVSYNFKNLPALPEKTKEVATSLFESLVDQHFNHFSHRGSRLLINPSVIEFQDTMRELKKMCTEEPSFATQTHGARVTRGANEGSYVLFSETRLTSEEELVLTAIHERELAEMINGKHALNCVPQSFWYVPKCLSGLYSDIPCRNKFIALELCQSQEPKDKIVDDAETIRHRINEQFLSELYKQLIQLRLQVLLEQGVRQPSGEEITADLLGTNPKLLNVILMESCDVKKEVPVRANEERVSNFLLRFRDAFRGAAIIPKLDENYDFEQGPRPSLFAKEVLDYVCKAISDDATKHNDHIHAEYKSQIRTRYEHAAEFQDITHTPGVLGAETALDFGLGEILGKISMLTAFISLKWSFTMPASSTELPTILGYHIQRRGHGRACNDGAGETSMWKRAAAFQVLSYEDVVRNGITPPTTVTVYGLATDTAYCFRIRACTAGGWGPFSMPTAGYRTQSAASTHDQRETIIIAASKEGPKGVANIMSKHSNIGVVQRYAAEVLATVAIKGKTASLTSVAAYLSCFEFFYFLLFIGPYAASGQNAGIQLFEPSDLQVAVAVRNAMLKFKMDTHLQQHGCLLFGRLAGSNGTENQLYDCVLPVSQVVSCFF